MNPAQLILLLNRSESETLDFKRKAPDFSNATEAEKGELIKDILAMANAWKEAPAYLIYGVEEEDGRTKNVCGTEITIADADIQQLVNSNTNRRVKFLVEVVEHVSVKLIIIQIDQVQQRPIYLKKNFGKLKANTAYIRRGSSTTEASLEEIAEIGKYEETAHRTGTMVNSFWKQFRAFWTDAEQRINYIHHTNVIFESTIAEYRLPVAEMSDFLKQAIELDLSPEFVGKLSDLLKDLRAMDEYMKKGAEAVRKWMPNFNSFKYSAFVHANNIKKLIPAP